MSSSEEYGRGFGSQNLNLFESYIQSFVAGNDSAHHSGLPSSVLVINDCLSILHGHPHGILLTVVYGSGRYILGQLSDLMGQKWMLHSWKHFGSRIVVTDTAYLDWLVPNLQNQG